MTPFDWLLLGLLMTIALVELATMLVIVARRRRRRRKARAATDYPPWIQMDIPDDRC
jgi:Flp pilus assembly protein TadB